MSFNDCKISESQIQTTGVQSQPDTLTGSAADNKMVFDALPTLAIQKLNSLIDQMQQQAAAGQIGVTPFDGMTAQTLQEALEQIQADIGGNYGGADGAGKVGYTPSEGVDEDTVQAAIEAVQANLTAYIAKIKAATGAAEVGNAPIAGMTATNVQQALEELRENIDNIVSGIIPGGSITSDMIQDGAVTADKLGSDVTGDTIPTSDSDPTTISSQLSNRLSNQITDRVQIPDGSDFATFMIDKPYGYYYVFGEDLVEGMPTTDRVWWFIWHVPSGIFAVSANTNELFRAEFTNNHLWAWRKIAFCEKPQEFDLPITAGYEDQLYQNTYYKTQDGIVHVSFYIRKTTSTAFDSQEVFATLPAGFRPSSELARDVGGDGINLGNGIVATEIHIRTNGEMYIWGVNSQINWVYGEVSFRAAD